MHKDMQAVTMMFSSMHQFVKRKVIIFQCELDKGPASEHICMCVWMVLRRDATLLQRVSSGLAQKRGSYYITKAQTHMFMCGRWTAEERTQRKKTKQAFFLVFFCFFNSLEPFFSLILLTEVYKWSNLMIIRSTTCMNVDIYLNECKNAKVTHLQESMQIMCLLCCFRWSSLWASWSTRLWIMG